jgi:hypothetical protein
VTAGLTALAGGLVASVIAAVWWLQRSFTIITIVGTSMQPTFEPADRVLVRRVPAGRIRIGDIVVAALDTRPARLPRDSPQLIIKRVVAVPGTRMPEEAARELGVAAAAVLHAGLFVVAGDNLSTLGNRHFAARRIVGIVVRRLHRHATAGSVSA